MSQFWGFPGADRLAIVAIIALCAACMFCARLFAREY
jgi:type IV secretory pathway VirB2 component (pilin)